MLHELKHAEVKVFSVGVWGVFVRLSNKWKNYWLELLKNLK